MFFLKRTASSFFLYLMQVECPRSIPILEYFISISNAVSKAETALTQSAIVEFVNLQIQLSHIHN